MTNETRDREIIVTDRGTSAGTVVAAVIGVLLVVFLGWMLFFNGESGEVEFENPLPEDVNVDITEDGGAGQ